MVSLRIRNSDVFDKLLEFFEYHDYNWAEGPRPTMVPFYGKKMSLTIDVYLNVSPKTKQIAKTSRPLNNYIVEVI